MARTRVQRIGDGAEAAVAARLAGRGWSVLGRNVRVGRAELDLVALDPGPPVRIVAVEVRWRADRRWGSPEETVDRAKVRRLRQALGSLVHAQALPDGTPLPRGAPAIDVVAVEPAAGSRDPRIRHLRDVE